MRLEMLTASGCKSGSRRWRRRSMRENDVADPCVNQKTEIEVWSRICTKWPGVTALRYPQAASFSASYSPLLS